MKGFQLLIVLLAVLFSTQAFCGESGDKLYREGKFAEAEKAYSRADMDYPRDLRYRYNRGCAAYRASNYKGAMASFSSALRRAQDDPSRYRSAYNLGNAAFKQGDFASAVASYEKALSYNPGSENARYNLELALRERERQGKEKNEKPGEKQGGQKPGDDKGKGKGKGRDKERPKREEARKGPENKEGNRTHRSEGKQNELKNREERQNGQEEARNERSADRPKDKSPKDLSGDLKLRTPSQGKGEKEAQRAPVPSDSDSIDKKRAAALLDNIKEDPSRLLQFQIPADKRQGVGSGKDW